MNTVRNTIFFLAFSFCFLLSSCHQPDTLAKKTERVANFECRAIALREHRFVLADSIRFTQDTLLHPANKADSIRLSQRLIILNNEKSKLLQTSLQLADTIHLAMDSIRKYSFKTANDRKEFDKKLQQLLAQKGCKAD